MDVLAFDTCMAACSVALLRSGKDDGLYRRFARQERGHSEALFPMIAAVMDEAGMAFADLGTIAVTRGPGSFTGVRAGIAAARGLALATGAAIVTATSLEVMALGCLDQLGPQACAAGFLIAHDARRGELYVQSFDADARAISEPVLATPEEAALLAVPCGLAAGSGAALVAAEAQRTGLTVRAVLPDLMPDAIHLARLALRREPEQSPVSPLYLRAPDAKPQLDKHLARA
jgi:tRNA threonylcarbamoyladenosine biosynthesis protein TsaB